jgi:hypothetical protein
MSFVGNNQIEPWRNLFQPLETRPDTQALEAANHL